MKWTDCPEFRPGSLEREIAADYRHDVRGGRYLFNCFLSDSRHFSATADHTYDFERVILAQFCRGKIGAVDSAAIQFDQNKFPCQLQ